MRTDHDVKGMLFGREDRPRLVAVEIDSGGQRDEAVLFFEREGKTVEEREPLETFIVARADDLSDCPVELDCRALKGDGELNAMAVFQNWKACVKASKWLAKKTGATPSAPRCPYIYINDPVQQHLLLNGMTSFMGMRFEEVRRLQLDIECRTTPGFSFCNAERDGDRILAIAVGDQTGWSHVICHDSERDILEELNSLIAERDPDVIEGHNLFNFDLPYIRKRAKLQRVKLTWGRDGSTPSVRPSRFSAGGRTLSYSRFEIWGRHVVDTLFLAHGYDASHRSLDGFGLKQVAVHFGVAPPDRTYVEGGDITRVFEEDRERLLRYVKDDVVETREVSAVLSRSNFVQAQMLPFSYQNVCVRGNATKIDALMLRAYLRENRALPRGDEARSFAGGYTDMFETGVVRNVHHCDIRSLYPSLMLVRKLGPRDDSEGVFLELLDKLRALRLDAKDSMRKAKDDATRNHYDALQSAFKILINSFYGYLGFAQARFGDFDAAEAVAEGGRELLTEMIDWLRGHGARPIEIDTDGIYFVPPEGDIEALRDGLSTSLPDGIEVEFDGEYEAMYSYKMKNYALLESSGEMIIKGAALKSRGLEPFQRDFMREVIRLKLEGREKDIPALKQEYEDAIKRRKWPVERLAKTEHLQDSPATYAAKKRSGKRSRSAAYELALASDQEYRAGDQISYYVTGEKKSVAVYEAARLVSDWSEDQRDENVVYYLAKLDSLYEKFSDPEPEAIQGELAL